MTRTETLRQCPFCGSKSVDLTEAYGRKTASVFVECLDCGATGEPFDIGYDMGAATAWNTRAERTAKPFDEYACGVPSCGECGVTLNMVTSGVSPYNRVLPNYCHNCGAKVIGSSKYEQGASSAKVVE